MPIENKLLEIQKILKYKFNSLVPVTMVDENDKKTMVINIGYKDYTEILFKEFILTINYAMFLDVNSNLNYIDGTNSYNKIEIEINTNDLSWTIVWNIIYSKLIELYRSKNKEKYISLGYLYFDIIDGNDATIENIIKIISNNNQFSPIDNSEDKKIFDEIKNNRK